MNIASKLALSTAALGLALVTAPSASAQQVVVEYPSDAYVAAYSPIWYNGFPHYYWHGHFFYRDHGMWHGYAHEPAGLWGHRGEWGTHRHRW